MENKNAQAKGAEVKAKTKNENVLRHIRVGGVEATVWKNRVGDRDTFSVTLQRNYKDRNGEWKTTHSFRQHDLPKALLALQKAFEHLSMSRAQ
jgi:hypothetical protein